MAAHCSCVAREREGEAGWTLKLCMFARAESEGRFCRRVVGARALPLLRAARRCGGLLRGGCGVPRGCGLGGGAGTVEVFPGMRLRTCAPNSNPSPLNRCRVFSHAAARWCRLRPGGRADATCAKPLKPKQAMGHLEWLQEFGDPVSNQPMGSTKENLNCAIVGEVAAVHMCALVCV